MIYSNLFQTLYYVADRKYGGRLPIPVHCIMDEWPNVALPDFQLTDMYIHNLERMISAVPQYWLWSHKRWKRTKEEWIRRQQEEKEKK